MGMSDRKKPLDEFLTDPEFVRWVRDPDPELEAYWLKWMAANPEKLREIKLARELILGLQFEGKSPVPDIRQTVLANILNKDSEAVKLKGKSRLLLSAKSFFWIRLGQASRVAAILLLVVSASFIVANWGQKTSPPESIAAVNIITKSTAYGERLNLKLSDGTQIWLNGGSELHYRERFDPSARLVYLKGEAFFEVAEAEEWPFSVVSNDLTTTALGTSFNIKNDETEMLSISLVSGKVKVENDLTDENILLLPGQQLQYSEETKKTFVGSFEENRVIGWKSGLLQFNHASFQKVVEELEKWYGVTVQVTGKPMRKWNLTGEYHNQNLELVLKRISYIEQFEFAINGKNVQIKF